jgi:hypothetical protein
LEELREVFGHNYSRRKLLDDLDWTVSQLRRRGVTDIWIGGSFTSEKYRPGDVDVVYDPSGTGSVDLGILSFTRRKELKKQRKIDLWPFPSPQPVKGNPTRTITILEFFQDTEDGIERGVIHLVDRNTTGGSTDDQEQATVRSDK